MHQQLRQVPLESLNHILCRESATNKSNACRFYVPNYALLPRKMRIDSIHSRTEPLFDDAVDDVFHNKVQFMSLNLQSNQ